MLKNIIDPRMVWCLKIIVLEFSMVSNERLYGLLLTDSMKIRGIARYYSLFGHIKNLGKIAKKKSN